MIVRRLRLNPFAFFRDKELEFLPGLNVVLGPNETGKSTIFHALKCALLRTKLTKPKFTQYLGNFLPSGGGDTLRVSLEFELPDGIYLLKRTWGPKPSSELVLPGKGVLTDDDAVKAALEEVLPATQMTFWKVLMTGQAELAATREILRGDESGAMMDLADSMRKAVLETGGVSVDRFKALLQEKVFRQNSHWDSGRNCPARDRGMENPWQTEVGEILRVYYEVETLKAAHAAALRYEGELDAANKGLREASMKASEIGKFISDNAGAARDAGRRKVLEAELDAIRARQEAARKAAKEWPVAESKAEEISGMIAGLSERVGLLERERLEAERRQAGRELREKLARVGRRQSELAQAEKRKSEAARLDAKDMEDIRGAARECELLEKGAEAGKLSVIVAAREDAKITVREDDLPETEKKAVKGKKITLSAESRIGISHPSLDIEIRSGEPDSRGARAKAVEARKRFQKLLAAHGVSGLQEAEERFRKAELLTAEVEAARKNLAEELGGERPEDLEMRAAAPGEERETRQLIEIERDLARAQGERESRQREKDELSRRLSEWQSVHGSQEKLIDSLADARRKEEELSRGIVSLAPLPRGYPDPDTFLRDFEAGQKEEARISEEKTALLLRKAGLEARAPESSAEELSTELEESRARFAASLRRGEALERILSESERLLARSNAEIYAGMKVKLERLVKSMTSDRYGEVEMEGPLPQGVKSGRGALSWERLSAGTRDTLALALRLAMAASALGEAGGFLLLDDPLVEMDPARQKAAARALEEFAKGAQLIFFTCHPSHAELLEGNLIQL